MIDKTKAKNTDIISDKEIETLIANKSGDIYKDNWEDFKRMLEKCVKNTDIEVVRKSKIVFDQNEKVAQGGFGTIYKCRLKRASQKTERPWIAKTVFYNSFNLRNVMNEIQLHASVNDHPNVVTMRKITFEVFKDVRSFGKK